MVMKEKKQKFSNLSSHVLSTDEKYFLSKGLDPTIKSYINQIDKKIATKKLQ